jgi:hypothetical protein
VNNDTPIVVATLAMFWKLKLLSPRARSHERPVDATFVGETFLKITLLA